MPSRAPQVQPASVIRVIGDMGVVCAPGLVRLGQLELALQVPRREDCRLAAASPRPAAPARVRAQPLELGLQRHAMLAAALAKVTPRA